MHFLNKPVAVICLTVAATVAHAEDAAYDFNIPAQPVSQVLDTLARQTGLQPVFADKSIQGVNSPGVKGRHTLREAVAKALAGTGLTFAFTAEKTAAIKPGTAPGKLATSAMDTAELAPITVTATRTERRVEDVPASVSVISAKDVSRKQPSKVEDLLRETQSIDINTSPGTGSPGVIMMRGIGGSFAGQTTAVLVNGMPTDSPISGVMGRGGLGFVAAQDIERIEIVRGPASALYGPNVVGGVINVIPKRWRGQAGAEVAAEYGSHNSRRLGAAIGVEKDAADFRLSVSDFKTDGFKPQENPDPWGEKDIGNRDWKETKMGLQGGVRPSDRQEITFGYNNYSTDAAYFGGRPNARQQFDGNALTLGYRLEFGDTATLKVSYRKGRVEQHSLFDDQYWNGNTGSFGLAAYADRVTDTDTLEAQTDLRLSGSNVLTFGASHQQSTYKWRTQNVTAAPAAYSEAKNRMTGLFVQDEHRFSDALTALVGGRYDWISMYGDVRNGVASNTESSDGIFNPRMGLRYKFSPVTSTYASIGSAYVPASNSLKFVGIPARFQDNPGLEPETSTTYEMGLEQKLGLGVLRASIFHTDYKDKISAVSVGAGFWPRQYVNIGKVEVNGLELELHGNLPGGWKPYANYTHTDSIIKKNPSDPLTEGKRTQRIAPNKLNLGVVYAPSSVWEARIGGRYVSERYFTDRNTANHRAPGYFVADAKVSARVPAPGNLGQWEAYLALNNLFDRKYTEWEYEHADRRNVWVGVNGKF